MPFPLQYHQSDFLKHKYDHTLYGIKTSILCDFPSISEHHICHSKKGHLGPVSIYPEVSPPVIFQFRPYAKATNKRCLIFPHTLSTSHPSFPYLVNSFTPFKTWPKCWQVQWVKCLPCTSQNLHNKGGRRKASPQSCLLTSTSIHSHIPFPPCSPSYTNTHK